MKTISNFKLWFVLLALAISSTAFADVPPGTAIDFDGVDDYVDVPYNFGGSLTEFTIQAWVNCEGTTGTFQSVFSSTGINFVHFQLNNSGNNVIYISPSIAILLPIVPETPYGSWKHVAIVAKSGASKVFVDGVQLGSTNTTTFSSIPIDVNNRIGSGYASGRFFNGQIDEFSIWSRALTQAEIQCQMNITLSGNETDLIVYYDFEEGVANGDNTSILTVLDQTTNNYQGTPYNLAKTGTSSNWVDGMTFTGSGFKVHLKDSNGNHLAGGSLEYREGGPNGWQTATEISDGVFCIDTERTQVGLRMTYSPQVLKVPQIPTNTDYTFQMENVTVELTDGGTPVDGGVVSYSSNGWHQFGSGTTGDDGSGIVTMDMLPTVYSFRMDYDGMHKFKKQIISSANKHVTFDIAELKTASIEAENDFQLVAYPNPFSGNTTIAFSLEEAREVNISVFDQTGRLLEVLQDGIQTEGNHKINWDASGVSKGVYFVRLSSGGKVVHQNIVKM